MHVAIGFASYSWFRPRDEAAMLEVNTNPIQIFFFRRICIKIMFSSQWRDRLLFSPTNMAAMTSRANQQLVEKSGASFAGQSRSAMQSQSKRKLVPIVS